MGQPVETTVVRRVPAPRNTVGQQVCAHDEGITIVSGNVAYLWCSKAGCGALGMRPKDSPQRSFTWVQPGAEGEGRAVEMRRQVNRQHKVDQCLKTR